MRSIIFLATNVYGTLPPKPPSYYALYVIVLGAWVVALISILVKINIKR